MFSPHKRTGKKLYHSNHNHDDINDEEIQLLKIRNVFYSFMMMMIPMIIIIKLFNLANNHSLLKKIWLFSITVFRVYMTFMCL